MSLLDRLDRRFRLCIASSSRIESVHLVADKFDFKDRFEALISDTGLDRGKPFPDVFIHAAAVMEVSAKECVVIEDSLAGLNAAKAADMKCIICPDDFCKIELSHFKAADLIIKDLAELTVDMISAV